MDETASRPTENRDCFVPRNDGLSAISYEVPERSEWDHLSPISYHLSAITYQLSPISYQLPAFTFQL